MSKLQATTTDGRTRCQSQSTTPPSNPQCIKPASHNEKEIEPTHTNGFGLFWLDIGGGQQECIASPGGEQAALIDWWMGVSANEAEVTIPKAIEYGATDLIDIGSQLGRFMRRDLTDAQAAELGCWFYLIGKMGRATSALERGEWPSDDTILDTGIYIKMIQRIRHSGAWPGTEIE